MAFQNITLLKRASDLLIGHTTNAFNFDDANITPAGMIPFGTVVFRAKGLAKAAPWAAVTATGNVVGTNEFGVVWGDGYGFAADFTPKAIVAKRYNAVVIKRGQAEFKEFYIKAVHATQLGTSFDVLKQLMADQGLVVLDDVSDFDGSL